ncbi:DUF262 domain-containing protein [Levilactobacillus brevis]|uniref:GmrSD restriction endonuclease domain-containing protein n=1 Tax=Levilactobacillus brevis TaxID=1580 RepID=UPI001BAD3344|nr:DUF262 domain-containing protein [Levilactobacillus brevis]MBS1006401.1 DUF262 domain-containing protein [Levilactobacillus brevis]
MANLVKNQYEVQNNSIGTVLNWIKSGEIGLPELQRPFIWKSAKVRDLIDSLYKGFPIGYLITWNNTTVKLKDGTSAVGKKIIIDGQQRITALRAALTGETILNKQLESKRIKIAFNPWNETFATATAPIEKNKRWITDISNLFQTSNTFSFINNFIKENDDKTTAEIDGAVSAIEKLGGLTSNDVGNIVLSSDLPIEDVTEIFNRINSKGTVLNSADFVMSKLSADEKHNGEKIRKVVDYFSKLLVNPSMMVDIKNNDFDFASSNYFKQIAWVINEPTDLYDPDFGDILHVILNFQFSRGKLTDLVGLISGRDFNTKTYTEEAMDKTYSELKTGLIRFTNKSNFKRYMMLLRSLGMISRKTLSLSGKGAINFGYSLYLLLKYQRNLTDFELEPIVKKWIIMSALTSRYSGSSETQSQIDIRKFANDDPIQYLSSIISQELPDSYWNNMLPNDALVSSSTQANVWRIFVMSQVRNNTASWLENDHKVADLLMEQGNIHHIFPRAYLKKHGISQTMYNQIANYVWITQPRNLKISDRAPKDYLSDKQVIRYGSERSFSENAIPESLKNMDYTQYEEFLVKRRQLIANKIREYFESL